MELAFINTDAVRVRIKVLHERAASRELRFCDLCLLHDFDAIFINMFGPPA